MPKKTTGFEDEMLKKLFKRLDNHEQYDFIAWCSSEAAKNFASNTTHD